ncbi:MAG: immunoglobulin domain-containing protein [Sedimentisphaerales bacterium]|nr:immunoglobulin domain-containing protein [Sedimentisphaerales bacterium]
MAVIFMTSQALALTLVLDGNLTEWVGDEVNNLGTEPAPDGGSYTLLATWDGTDVYLAIDRDSSNRYLGDTGWDNDSFFIAFDTDGIADSGADWDGYSRMNFAGPMKPDVIYYYAGGPSWYERSVWNGGTWDWQGWTDADSYYGYSETHPDDELVPDLLTQAPGLSGASELMVWAWMTREGNGFAECTWPRWASGFYTQVFGDPVKIRDLVTRLYMPHDQSPGLYEREIDGDAPITVSWQVAQDPCGVVDPQLDSYKIYLSGPYADEPNYLDPEPNVYYQDTVSSWTAGEASLLLGSALAKDSLYFWRVDTVLDNETEIEGDLWSFYTEITVPAINSITPYQILDPCATAQFTVDVTSVSTPSYQWYKYVDGVSDIELADAGDISGTDTATLSIANVETADEGYYYCEVNNDSGVPATSALAPLAIKARIAYWDFESGNANSTVPGSPVSKLVGDPAFVAAAGVAGDAMAFDADTGAQDMLYIDPNFVDYFDICNYEMTVACWIKSTNEEVWVPMVARNGDDNQGWQLRQSGFTDDRPCFTTRGTGNPDGTPANRTVYDGNWHYVVGTYDGMGGIKKVYIDGQVSWLYSEDDGSPVSDGDAVSVPMNASLSPVAIAGRVRGEPGALIIDTESVCAGTYDEVEIYNYALDAATIAQTYADMTDTTVCPDPTVPVYDLDGNCIVDLGDFVKIAMEWLDDTNVQPTP